MQLKRYGDMRTGFVIITIVLMTQVSMAQTIFSAPPLDRNEDFDRGFALSLVIPSYMTSPHSNMSRLLVQNGYPPIPRGSLSFGLGLAYRFKKWEPGFDVTLGNQVVTNYDQGSEILRRPLNSTIFVKYHLIRKGYFTFFPIVGLSISDTNLIASKQSSVDDVNQLLQDPGTSVNMQHLSAGLLTGVGVANSQFWEEFPGVIRLKFTYRVPFGEGYAWESLFANIESTSPLDNFPYFSIQLEIGGMMNWNKNNPPSMD